MPCAKPCVVGRAAPPGSKTFLSALMEHVRIGARRSFASAAHHAAAAQDDPFRPHGIQPPFRMAIPFGLLEAALDIACLGCLFLILHGTPTTSPFQGFKNAHQSDSISGRGCGIAYTAHVCRVGAGSDCQFPRHHSPPCTRTGATRTGKPVARPRSPSVFPADTDEWSLGSAIRGEGCCVLTLV